MPKPRKELRRLLNQALKPNNGHWQEAATEFFRLLREDKVTPQTVVFGIRTPSNANRESPFEAMTRQTAISRKGEGDE